MPVIILVLATGYLLTIYLLLMLAQRALKGSSYKSISLTDTSTHLPVENEPQSNEVERWSIAGFGSVSSELPTPTASPQSVRNVSSIP